MFIVQILVATLVGYIIGFSQEHLERKKKERECLNKKQMIENRDILIDEQQKKIIKLKIETKIYEQIKEIFKTEKSLINRHDKTKELIDKDN